MNELQFSQMKEDYKRQLKKDCCEILFNILKAEEGKFLAEKLHMDTCERAVLSDHGKVEILCIHTYCEALATLCETRLVIDLDNLCEEKMYNLIYIRMRSGNTAYDGKHPYGKEFHHIPIRDSVNSLELAYEYLKKKFKSPELAWQELKRIMRGDPIAHPHSFTETFGHYVASA